MCLFRNQFKSEFIKISRQNRVRDFKLSEVNSNVIQLEMIHAQTNDGLAIVNFLFFFLFSIKTSHAHTTKHMHKWTHAIHKHGAHLCRSLVSFDFYSMVVVHSMNGTKCVCSFFFVCLNTTDSKIYGNCCLFGAHAISHMNIVYFIEFHFKRSQKPFACFLLFTTVVAVRLHREFDEKLIIST